VREAERDPRDVQREHPEIALWNTNIDAQMMWLTKNPEDYGVIVAGNMFGDIVSDGFAGLVGGLGFAASANVGANCAVFEPTHGSAPKYAEYEESIVNPIAMVLSACLMLDHLGERIISRRIQYAVSRVIAAGEVQTYDMKRFRGSPEALAQGAASTRQMADAIIAAL
jgi:3-isopropylmalate dehydrogenase